MTNKRQIASVRFTGALEKRMFDMMDKKGMTQSEFLRTAVREYLERHESEERAVEERRNAKPAPPLVLSADGRKTMPFSAAKLQDQTVVFCNVESGAFQRNRKAIEYAIENQLLSNTAYDEYTATINQVEGDVKGAPRMTSTAWAGSISFSAGMLMWVLDNGREDASTKLASKWMAENSWILDGCRNAQGWRNLLWRSRSRS